MRNILLIIALSALLPSAEAFSTMSIFSAVPHCVQVNSTFIACPDGVPIPISFSASSPYMPYYGNFTVYVANNNNYTEPLNMYGDPCSMASSTTITCSLTALPIPIGYGNGTVKKSVGIVFVSSRYPQVYFKQRINVTIMHYTDTYENMILSVYNNAYSTYAKANNTYSYLCSTYMICNQTLNANLTKVGVLLSEANASIYSAHGNSSSAYKYAVEANSTLAAAIPLYIAFVNNSDSIVNADLKAEYSLVGATNLFESNESILYNCSTANGTSYGSTIANEIVALQQYKVQNTKAAAYIYLNKTTALRQQVNSSVAFCNHRKEQLQSVGGITMPKYVPLYGSIAVVAVLAIYSFMKFRESKYISEVRNRQERPAEEPEDVQKSSLEESFNNWLDNAIGKGKQNKQGKQ